MSWVGQKKCIFTSALTGKTKFVFTNLGLFFFKLELLELTSAIRCFPHKLAIHLSTSLPRCIHFETHYTSRYTIQNSKPMYNRHARSTCSIDFEVEKRSRAACASPRDTRDAPFTVLAVVTSPLGEPLHRRINVRAQRSSSTMRSAGNLVRAS